MRVAGVGTPRTLVVQLVALRLETPEVLRLIPHGDLVLLDLGPVVAAKAILRGRAALRPHRDATLGVPVGDDEDAVFTKRVGTRRFARIRVQNSDARRELT